MHDGVVVARGCPRKEVVGQAEGDEVFNDETVVPIREFACAHALGVGGDEDWGAVLVGSRNHEDVMTGHSHVAREDIGGDSESGDVSNMTGAVGVGPCDGGQNSTHSLLA